LGRRRKTFEGSPFIEITCCIYGTFEAIKRVNKACEINFELN